MKRSAISWCDFSGGDLNFVWGCTPVSAGCENCYARASYKRFGRDFSKVSWDVDKLWRATQRMYPLPGNKRGPGRKPLLFVCDTGDLFHPTVTRLVQRWAIADMGRNPYADWAILTKRPENIPGDILWPDNVWLGVTAENQEMADERIPLLLATGARVKFVCVEPMLGPVSLTQIQWDKYTSMNVLEGCGLTTAPGMMGQSIPNCYCGKLDWVIVGGESGPHRRPFDPRWANYIWQECQGTGVPMFYKQGSALRPGQDDLLDGREIKEWPM